jgi:hypothetical protein
MRKECMAAKRRFFDRVKFQSKAHILKFFDNVELEILLMVNRQDRGNNV